MGNCSKRNFYVKTNTSVHLGDTMKVYGYVVILDFLGVK